MECFPKLKKKKKPFMHKKQTAKTNISGGGLTEDLLHSKEFPEDYFKYRQVP